MKKIIPILILLLCVPQVYAAPWVDDWYDQMTVSSPGYFEGQRRGYLSGGSFQARWKMTNENPFAVQMPKIKSGCGGIDVFAGGLSFLDPDLLVDKLQGIVQAAPAVAFDMALKTMCKECSETMKAMERAASWLNGLQLNDCALSKRLVATVASDDKDIVSEMQNEISGGVSLNQALNRNFIEHKEDTKAAGGQPVVPLSDAVRDCPAEFRNIFANGGSVVDNVTNQIGMNQYADLLRGYIGDVLVNYVPASNAYRIETIEPCRGNDAKSLDDVLTGSSQERPAVPGGVCVNNTATDVGVWIEAALTSIADKIRNNAVNFTADEQEFIDRSPLPVYQIMKTGVITGTEASTLSVLRDPVAIAYAYKAFDDLYKQATHMVDKALESANMPGTSAGGDIDFCNPKVLEGAIGKVRKWKPMIASYRQSAKESYDSEVAALSNRLTVIKFELEKKIKAEQDGAESLAGH